MSRIVLASRSPRRRELLEQAGFRPEILAAEVDEAVRRGESPRRYVRRLALEKARLAARRLRGGGPALVIAADTAVVVDGRVLGKPADRAHGRRMLRLLSGRAHEVLTGYAVLPVDGAAGAGTRARPRPVSAVIATRVEFKPLRREEIEAYLSTGEPFDKAGAYAIQGAAAFMVRRIRGSHANVIGLPVCEVVETLRAFGAHPSDGRGGRLAARRRPAPRGGRGSRSRETR